MVDRKQLLLKVDLGSYQGIASAMPHMSQIQPRLQALPTREASI